MREMRNPAGSGADSGTCGTPHDLAGATHEIIALLRETDRQNNRLQLQPDARGVDRFRQANTAVSARCADILTGLDPTEILTATDGHPGRPGSSADADRLLAEMKEQMAAIDALPGPQRPMETYTFVFHVKLDLMGIDNAIHHGHVTGLTAQSLADDVRNSMIGLAGSAYYLSLLVISHGEGHIKA